MSRLMTIVTVMCVALMGNAMVAQAQELLVNGNFEAGPGPDVRGAAQFTAGWNYDAQVVNAGTGISTTAPAGAGNGGGGTYSHRFDVGDPACCAPRVVDAGQGATLGHLGPVKMIDGNAIFSISTFLEDAVGIDDQGANSTVFQAQLRFRNANNDVKAEVNFRFDNTPAGATTSISGPGHNMKLNLTIGNPTRGSWQNLTDVNIKDLFDSQPGFTRGDGLSWWDEVDPADGPMTSVSLNLQARTVDFNANDARHISGWVDNASLVNVPEPMTMSLLALGALGILRRKRS